MDDNDGPYVEDLIGEVLQATNRSVTITGVTESDIAHWKCHQCGKMESKDRRLQKCNGCKRAFYCSEACQKTHWNMRHKYFCRSIQTQNKLSREEGYTRFEEVREHKKIYVLECDKCQGKMFCNNVGSGCTKQLVWQGMADTSQEAALLDHIDSINRFYQRNIVNGRKQGNELRWLYQFYKDNNDAFVYEDRWLLYIFMDVCTRAAIRQTPQRFLDGDYPNNHPPVPISLQSLGPYMGQDDDDDIEKMTCIAHCILHTVSCKLNTNYEPNSRPKELMHLVRFLDKICYQVDICLLDDLSQISMKPSSIFVVYLAKKRARILLEKHAMEKAKEATKKAAAKKAAK